MCLNDENDKVKGLASLFFTELSKRSNNPVYNLLGDVISFLSRSESDVSVINNSENSGHSIRTLTQNEFQSTMTFLLSFVKKDRYASLKYLYLNLIHLVLCIIQAS